MHRRRVDANLAEVVDALQRLEQIGADMHRMRGEERRLVAVDHIEVGEIGGAGHAQRRRIAGHDEIELQIARQFARLHGHRQLHRCVRQQTRHVEPVKSQRHLRLARLRKRLGLAVERERTAVDTHAQQRLDEDIGLRRQRRDKRNTELPLIDDMLFVQQPVVECDLAVFETDVRHGKQRRLAFRLRRLFREFFYQIAEIEALRIVANDMKARRVDLHFVDDRRRAKQRRPGRPHDQPFNIDEVAGAAAFADMNAVGFEIQRVGIERDAADRGGPVELLGQLLRSDMANQRRRGEETEQPEQHKEDQQPDDDTAGAPAARDIAYGLQGGCERCFIEACHSRSRIVRRQARRRSQSWAKYTSCVAATDQM
ncbi:hypothetical protein LMG29739_03575 [Paraburkholderia solisilvae]|uniref:Uncharacterized protein n=1 Tax=Paraburkholderia solisilvae TaxID=624376 RepID=A0A6J5E7W1_9BURK|nr:hypothetical protein LMG29739_03575 [Paraburkholderia solisilvae]